jgi:hypothetical protein
MRLSPGDRRYGVPTEAVRRLRTAKGKAKKKAKPQKRAK